MIGRSSAGLVLCSLLCAGAAHAQRGPMREEDVVRLAVARDASLRQSDARIARAEAERDGALFAFIPEVQLSARYTRLSDLPASARTLDLGAGPDAVVVIPQLLDQLASRVTVTVPATDLVFRASRTLAAAGEGVAAERLGRQATELRVAAGARLAYWELARAEATVERLEAVEARYAAWQREIEERVRLGALPPTEALEVRTSALVLRRDRLAAEAARDVALSRLRTVIGAPDDAPLALAPAPAEPPTLAVGTLARARERALVARPELLANEHARRALSELSTQTRAQLAPSVALVFGAEVAAPNARAFAQTRLEPVATWDASVQVSWSLAEALQAESRARRLDADADALEAEREGLARALSEEAAAAFAASMSASERLQVAVEALDLTRALVESRRAQHARGALTVAQLALVEIELLRAELALVDARVELRLAAARLDAACGVSLH